MAYNYVVPKTPTCSLCYKNNLQRPEKLTKYIIQKIQYATEHLKRNDLTTTKL